MLHSRCLQMLQDRRMESLEEIGLLAEVLGFKEKGKVWKGP